MKALKGFGTFLAGAAAMIVLWIAVAVFIYGFAWLTENLMWYILSAGQIALAITLLILLPLALFRATRKVACMGLYIASFVFGFVTWVLGFATTYFYWGGIGVVVGIVLGVVGLVPIGILACLFKGDWYATFLLLFGLVLTYGSRAIALYLANKIDREEEARLLRTA
jgi:hypothetical protein